MDEESIHTAGVYVKANFPIKEKEPVRSVKLLFGGRGGHVLPSLQDSIQSPVAESSFSAVLYGSDIVNNTLCLLS